MPYPDNACKLELGGCQSKKKLVCTRSVASSVPFDEDLLCSRVYKITDMAPVHSKIVKKGRCTASVRKKKVDCIFCFQYDCATPNDRCGKNNVKNICKKIMLKIF